MILCTTMDYRSPLSRVMQYTSEAPLLNQYDPLYSRRTYPRFVVPGWAHILLGLLLLILGLADIGYTSTEYGSNCLYTGKDFNPGPCKADHIYTYAASPVWGGIIMMLTGAMSFWMTPHRLRFNMWILKAFCGFSIFLVIIICPAILVLNILEIVQNKNTFWKDENVLILYDEAKFYMPLGILILAFIEWIVAIISACVCVCCLPRDLISRFNDMGLPMPNPPYREYFNDRPQPPIIIKDENQRCNTPTDRYICKDVPDCRNDPIIIRERQPCKPQPQQYIIKEEPCYPQQPPPQQYIIKEDPCRPQQPPPQPIIIRQQCPPAQPQQPIIIKEECQQPPQQPIIVCEEYIRQEPCEIPRPRCIQEEVVACPPPPVCEVTRDTCRCSKWSGYVSRPYKELRRPSYVREQVLTCPPPQSCIREEVLTCPPPAPLVREEYVTCPPQAPVVREEMITCPPQPRIVREEVVTRQPPCITDEVMARPALLAPTRDNREKVIYEEHIRPGDRNYDAYRSSNLDLYGGRREEDVRSIYSGHTDYGARRLDNYSRWDWKRY